MTHTVLNCVFRKSGKRSK